MPSFIATSRAITLTDDGAVSFQVEVATIRICEDGGQIVVTLFTGGHAELEAGRMTFSHQLAARTFIAAAIDQLAADYLP